MPTEISSQTRSVPVLQNPNCILLNMDECRVVGKWARKRKGATVEFTRNVRRRKYTPKIKKYSMEISNSG